MRRIALITGIIGLGFLVAFLLVDGLDIEGIDGLSVGEIVSFSGIVKEERKFGNGKLLIINEIPVFCECSNQYVSKRVIVEGVVERFLEDLRIKAFFIKILD